MNPQEQNAALWEWAGGNEFVGLKKRGLWYGAKANGYTSCECNAGRFTREEAKKHEYPHDEPVNIVEFSPPDYLSDLTAVAALEKRLDAMPMDDRSKWIDLLAVACEWPVTNNAADLKFEVQYLCARATAQQRCEALLKMLGLWKP